MIPKIIHYCWFGGNPLPEDAKRYIESWKKYCPDYEIKEWNEKNFDLDMYPYVREAYDNRKFAFVTDVVRLYACYHEGGLYMDTDVEVLKNLDRFLVHDGVSGFESSTQIPTGMMGCCKGFPLFKELLDEYEGVHFVKPDGSLDRTTNVIRITNTCLKYGFVPNSQYQVVNGFALYPSEFFCPKDCKDGVIRCTENSYTIHHFAGSWLTGEEKKRSVFRRKVQPIFGDNFFSDAICGVYSVFSRMREKGLSDTMRYYKGKITGKK